MYIYLNYIFKDFWNWNSFFSTFWNIILNIIFLVNRAKPIRGFTKFSKFVFHTRNKLMQPTWMQHPNEIISETFKTIFIWHNFDNKLTKASIILGKNIKPFILFSVFYSRRSGLVQVVESYRLWPEGPEFESRSLFFRFRSI